MRISEAKLRIVSEAMERLVQWPLNTLKRLSRESSTLLTWLKSCHSDHPDPLPFRLPQEPTTLKRYVNHWKQLIFYVLRTFLLNESTHDRIYGIRFTEDQIVIIEQLLEMLNTYDENKDQRRLNGRNNADEEDDEDDEDFHQYDPDEDDEEDENLDEFELTDGHVDDDDAAADVDEEYSSFLTRVAEKLMQLSIAFITQYFPSGDDLHSPLTHFVDVMGISNRTGQFNEAYNYTSYVAGLLWICRFLIMEYALPSREYTTLNWPSHEAYFNKSERLKEIHDNYLVQGSARPINRLIRVLSYGRETIKAVGRPGVLMWDPDEQGLKIKEVHLRLDAFKELVRDGIELTESVLREELFFGMDLPMIDLNKIDDNFGKIDNRYSFLKESANELPNGRRFMFNLMRSADPSKQLIDSQGRWDMIKVRKYLKGNERFKRKLMKGIIFIFILLIFRCIFNRWNAV